VPGMAKPVPFVHSFKLLHIVFIAATRLRGVRSGIGPRSWFFIDAYRFLVVHRTSEKQFDGVFFRSPIVNDGSATDAQFVCMIVARGTEAEIT